MPARRIARSQCSWRGQSPTATRCFFTTNSTHSAANAAVYKSVPYDPIKDFTPIARIGSFPSFVARSIRSCRSTPIGELMSACQGQSGQALRTRVGNSTGHIAGETIKEAHRNRYRARDYRSNPAVVTDLIAGHIPMAIPDFNTGRPAAQDAEGPRARGAGLQERNWFCLMC